MWQWQADHIEIHEVTSMMINSKQKNSNEEIIGSIKYL